MKRIFAFIKGAKEFKSDVTTSYNDYGILCCYDMGREFMHIITFRKYDV